MNVDRILTAAQLDHSEFHDYVRVMPIYEFRCAECNRTDEYLQKVTDPTPSECSACGKKGSLQKVVSQTSFQLKGGGWYSDLYASPKKEVSAPAKAEPAQSPVSKKNESSSSD